MKKVNKLIRISIIIAMGIFLVNLTYADKTLVQNINIEESSTFLENHTPEIVFDNDEENNYACAKLNDFPNYFIADFNQPVELRNIAFKWFNEKNYPTDFKVYGYCNNKWELLIDERNYKTDNINKSYYIKNFDDAKKIQKIKFVCYETNGQQQLMIKRILLNKNLETVKDLNDKILSPYKKISDHQVVTLFMKWIGDNVADNAMGVEPVEILNYKKGACGSKAYLLMAMCEERGMKGRLVELYNYPTPGLGHSLCEINYDGKWRLYDPTYGAYYTNTIRDVANYVSPDVASLEEIRKQPNKVDENKVIIRLNKYYMDQDMDAMYVKSDAYKKANPIGNAGKDKPMLFPATFDLKSGEMSYGVNDNNYTDMQDLYAVPQGMYVIGSSYFNVNHQYKMMNLQKGSKYRIEIGLINPRDFNINVSAQNAKIITAETLDTSEGKFDIEFIPTSNEAEVYIKHNYDDGQTAVLIDYIRIYKVE